jgi:crossover junction endodeoxyribonuclease RuvC
MRVIGIDPGTRVVGYGVVDARGNQLLPVAFGAIRPKAGGTYEARLRRIFDELTRLFREYAPDETAIEEAFYGKSVSAALRMGEGRGVAIIAAAVADQPVHQYSPAEVKKAVVGNGRAHKSQVQEMVRMLLGLRKPPQPEDAADALAVAVCHCNRPRDVLPA